MELFNWWIQTDALLLTRLLDYSMLFCYRYSVMPDRVAGWRWEPSRPSRCPAGTLERML